MSSAPEIAMDPRSASKRSPTSAKAAAINLDSLPRNILGQIAFHLVVDSNGVGRHPKSLLSLLRTSKQIHYAIGFDQNPQLYHDLYCATFDTAAIKRRYAWMKQHLTSTSKGAPKTFDLFEDPRAFATDYKGRWDVARRSKREFETGEITESEREQYATDLWILWFLLTENDDKNFVFLTEELRMYELLWYFYNRFILPATFAAVGYPADDGLTALGLWCALMTGADLRRPYNAQQTDEKIFMLRPYVFACFKYDISYAPWQQRRLPLCHPGCREHDMDVTMQSKALPYKRFGYTWRRAPPHFTLGAILMLWRVMERFKEHVIQAPWVSRFSPGPNEPAEPTLFTSYEIMSSLNHDREWQRNSVCQDPHTSFGLPAHTFRGEMEGFWRGRFIWYRLDMYRKILAGDMRTLYTGEFSLQAMEFEIKETIIKVRKDEVGGSGNVLDAGFDSDYTDKEREQERVLAGYGHPVVDDPNEPDEEGYTKETLLSGKARLLLGCLYLRGRIRSWDGMVLLSLDHENPELQAMSKWIWRGYIHTGGYLIGRWRDTFTPANYRGFEGGFVMVRAGSQSYPPSFPVRMVDSLGVSQETGGSAPIVTPNPEPIRPELDFSGTSMNIHREPERGSSSGSATTSTTRSEIDSTTTMDSIVESPISSERFKEPMQWHGSGAEPVAVASSSSAQTFRPPPIEAEYPGKRERSDAELAMEDRKGKRRA